MDPEGTEGSLPGRSGSPSTSSCALGAGQGDRPRPVPVTWMLPFDSPPTTSSPKWRRPGEQDEADDDAQRQPPGMYRATTAPVAFSDALSAWIPFAHNELIATG